jgi:hypothetical protein
MLYVHHRSKQWTRRKLLCKSDNPKVWVVVVLTSILELSFRIDGATGANDLDGSRLWELFEKDFYPSLHLGSGRLCLFRAAATKGAMVAVSGEVEGGSNSRSQGVKRRDK